MMPERGSQDWRFSGKEGVAGKQASMEAELPQEGEAEWRSFVVYDRAFVYFD